MPFTFVDSKRNKNNKNKLAISFNEALQRFNWENKTKNSVISLFEDYQKYLNKNYSVNQSKILSEIKNKETDQFFKEENIVSFLQEFKNYNNNTFNNRLGLFRRIIRVMLENSNWNYINHSVKEKKTKNEKLLTIAQKVNLLNSINNKNSKDLFILFELVFDLGYSVYQVSKMKVKDIYLNQNIIEILYKGKKKIRHLKCSISKIIKNHITNKNLSKNNYIVFNEFIETKIMNRKKYLHLLLSNLILNCKELNDNNKDNIIEKINTERKSFTLEYIEPIIIDNDNNNNISRENNDIKNSFNFDIMDNSRDDLKLFGESFCINNAINDNENIDSFFWKKIFMKRNNYLFI